MPGFRKLTAALVLAASSAALVPNVSFGEEWPTFRGPQRTAVAPDQNLLQEWPKGGPKLVWTAKGAGRGYASVAVVGGRIYTLGDGLSTANDQDEYLTCFDQKSGQQIWKTKTGQPWTEGKSDWQNSRSTPTVDGNLVYVVTPHGQLICCETASGKEVWRKDLKKDFGGSKGDAWGYSESVLVDGNQVVCTPGSEKNTMVALNKKTGDVIWTTSNPGDRGAGHASIVISEVGGKRVYVQTTASGAIGVSAKEGALLWTYPIDKTTAVIPTPIVKGDLVFMVAGYRRGGALLRQVPGPGGTIKAEEIYGLKTELANKHGGVVLVGDYLYGDSDDQGIPYCAELMTGEVKWKKRGSGRSSASVIAADGRLYIRYSDGTLSLAKADPNDHVEVGSFKIPGSGERPSWAHPVIVDGMLYLREQDSILCYDIRES